MKHDVLDTHEIAIMTPGALGVGRGEQSKPAAR